MMMDLFRLIEGHAFVFHPGMRFEVICLFGDSNSYAGGNTLKSQQIPEGQGFLQAARTGHGVVDGGADHAASFLHNYLAGGGHGQHRAASLQSDLQPFLRLPITAQAQRHPNERK